MTGEEIKKYINQIAFSGATEFVEKFKDKGDVKDIIGKFGLGFYSAFMVADNVEIKSLSYKDGSEPVRWICDGSTEFTLSSTEKTTRGTDIILHVNEDSVEFLEKHRLQTILEKYCKFLPVSIEFDEKIINKNPLWTKTPSELKDEDYLAFYKELYPFSEDPLFWIHLNVDYPFSLTGILYFPKVKNEFEPHKNKIQLYSRQVFITDEVKDIVPEFPYAVARRDRLAGYSVERVAQLLAGGWQREENKQSHYEKSSRQIVRLVPKRPTFVRKQVG